MEKPIYEKIIVGSVTILKAKNKAAVDSQVSLVKRLLKTFQV